MTTLYGGTPSQGVPIGILMVDSVLPRIPGDVGNGFTYDFPVRFHTVKGARAIRIVEDSDPALLQPFIDGARALEAEGCQAITTCCGFLIAFQRQMQAAVNIPVFTSGLLQVPLVAAILPPDKKIGILTANDATLNPKHFAENVPVERLCVQGMQDTKHFYRTFPLNAPSYIYEDVEADVAWAAKKLKAEHPDIGAIVCEGTNFAPFNPMVCRMTGVPVFDIVTLTRWVASGILRGFTSPFRNQLTGGPNLGVYERPQF
jgi:Asp/Glu/hydantoin racemase